MDKPYRNLVAKHARTFNKAHIHKDRKKAYKSGYQKYTDKEE